MGMESSYFVDTFKLYAKNHDDWGEATTTETPIPC
jgi:hypothetical protein